VSSVAPSVLTLFSFLIDTFLSDEDRRFVRFCVAFSFYAACILARLALLGFSRCCETFAYHLFSSVSSNSTTSR